jgi:hypothetical protein
MAATTIATTVPASTATTTVVENSSTAISPNFSACNGFNLSATGPGSTVSGQCNWAGGLLNMALYGGNFNEVGIHINQINTTVPFTANYYVSSCASNSTTQHVPVGEFNITFTTGPVAQVGIRCGNATVRLTKT